MKELHIPGTSKTPNITYKDGNFSVSGCSIPSDARKIFKSVLTFFEDKRNFPADHYIVEIRFEYCDTASLKWILNILQAFQKNASCQNIEMRWYYESDDYEMLELGEFVQARIEAKLELVQLRTE